MIKKLLPIACCLAFVLSCSTTPNLTQLNSLKPGITKAELADRFGEPISTDYVDVFYLLKYLMYDPQDIGHRPYYFVFDSQCKMVSWQEIRGAGKKVNVSGIVLNLSP